MVATKCPKNMTGPIWSQCLVCQFRDTAEKWWLSMVDSVVHEPAASGDLKAHSKITIYLIFR